ncbi:MAG: hypothetical protein QOJ51_5311 [Acidobacteriaceae bacterium]|nr:hypothetical protein [Acidobacteriaceae bacterium]MEA2262486.1 hypothetical protein [Acidobacteriaceae bacterium]
MNSRGVVKSGSRCTGPPYRGYTAMKSKLLQKIDKSREGPDGQRENTEESSVPLEATRNRKTRSTWLLTLRPLSNHSSQSGA